MHKPYMNSNNKKQFSSYEIVPFMASRHFAIVNSLDTHGTYKSPEQTMLFRRIIGS
jgi:hypothetical protein